MVRLGWVGLGDGRCEVIDVRRGGLDLCKSGLGAQGS